MSRVETEVIVAVVAASGGPVLKVEGIEEALGDRGSNIGSVIA